MNGNSVYTVVLDDNNVAELHKNHLNTGVYGLDREDFLADLELLGNTVSDKDRQAILKQLDATPGFEH